MLNVCILNVLVYGISTVYCNFEKYFFEIFYIYSILIGIALLVFNVVVTFVI